MSPPLDSVTVKICIRGEMGGLGGGYNLLLEGGGGYNLVGRGFVESCDRKGAAVAGGWGDFVFLLEWGLSMELGDC